MSVLRMLTSRGWTLVILGAIVTVAAMLFGQNDLLWLGLLLIALPAVAMVMVGRSRMSLAVERRLNPARAPLGERLRGSLTLTKRGSLPLGLLQFEEAIPRQLGRRPRFTVHRFAGEWSRQVNYPLEGLERGRYQVGPLLVRATDPFGLAKMDRRFASTRETMITPRIVPLSSMGSATGQGQSGDSTPQRIGLVGADDVLVREYRAGDDVRRIHWRSTARRDELMVRREEQAWDPSVSVLLDNRSSAHAGMGQDSSFEWAVSAAASVAMHMISSGYRLSILDTEGPLVDADTLTPDELRESVALTLTDVTMTSHNTSLATMVRAATGHQTGEVLIAITGRLSRDDVHALVAMRSHRAQGLAMVLDVDTFTARRFRGDESLAGEHEAAIDLLRRHAWRVVEVTGTTTIDEAWRSLDRVGVTTR
ncbi:DUF58 domain-containing protein [Aestuariimicrobium sp. T2.26MG-19.2B]|uniref:DUF58 domain-containing protein n=1 Tax=Aestuariimicrobium sp. T2.26MG-19.2B TaxID=3040679 RepID=UPI00253F97AD|nr:DUF58 domain-containing protein [Aestuariimicrobium sp. T2.26MG-19.2B]